MHPEMCRFLPALLFVLSVVPSLASAQYRFDIKTELEEKADLKIVKQDVIRYTTALTPLRPDSAETASPQS